MSRGVAAVIVAKSHEEGTLLRADADEESSGRDDGEHEQRQPVARRLHSSARVPLLLKRLRKRMANSPSAKSPNSVQKATFAPGCS